MSMHFAKALCLDKGICTEACVNNVYSMFVMKQYVFLVGNLPRSVQQGISKELAASKTPVTVDESLPMAGDSDPTVPMDLSSGMSASVEGLLRNEMEKNMESDGENAKNKAWFFPNKKGVLVM